MFILLNKKKIRLSVWSSSSSFSSSSSLHSPSSSLSLLSYTGTSNICARHNTPLVCHYVQALVVLEGNRSKTSPLFFRIEIILPKCPNFAWQNGMFIKKTISTQTMISCVMSCNSRFI